MISVTVSTEKMPPVYVKKNNNRQRTETNFGKHFIFATPQQRLQLVF